MYRSIYQRLADKETQEERRQSILSEKRGECSSTPVKNVVFKSDVNVGCTVPKIGG